MDDDDLRVCGKIFCLGEEVHLISRFEEDQILEIGTALFMIFSFLTVILHFFNKLLFFYILPLRSASDIQVSRGKDNWNRPGLVDDHEKDEENVRKL